MCEFFFFFNDTATTEIYTLSLHDALPICFLAVRAAAQESDELGFLEKSFNKMIEEIGGTISTVQREADERSEEHTSELQSQSNLVCRLLLEKKNGMLTLPLAPGLPA